MAWNGIGTYVLNPSYSPEANGAVIDATRYNGLTTDIATGITQALNKNGENSPTANINWGGLKITNLGSAVTTGDAISWGGASSFTTTLYTVTTNTVTGIVGASAVSDTFTVDTDKLLSNYGLAWKSFSDEATGASAALSAYGGMRFYTAGAERVRIDHSGNVGIGGAPVFGLSLEIGQAQSILSLNSTTGTFSSQIQFRRGNSIYGVTGSVGQANAIIAGSVAGDFAYRNGAGGSGRQLWSVDDGVSVAMSLSQAKLLTVAGGINTVSADNVGMGIAAARVKTAATSRSSTTTLTDDPHLIVPLAVGVWKIRLWAPVSIAVSGGSNGWKIAFPFTGTASGDIGMVSSPDILLSAMQTFTLSTGTALSGAATTPSGWMIVEGSLTVTVAGNLKFQWAQNSSGTQNLTFGQGATLVCTKVG